MQNYRHALATLVLLSAAAATLATPANATDEQRRIAFAKGATAKTVSGKIIGYNGVDYLVETGAGQLMHLLFAPSNRSCYFNVFEPGASEATHIGSSAGNEFAVERTKSGSYRVQVYLMRNAARRSETCRYRLSVEIAGPRGGISAGTSDQMKRDVCKAEAAAMYGVEQRQITLAPARSVAGADQIDGTADKKADGVKKLRCIFKPDGGFDRIMAMTPDGE